jgi:hypothetical protein
MALGVVGSPNMGSTDKCTFSAINDDQDSRDVGLGEFGFVCGPYSKREWSMNWDFIFINVLYVSKLNDCVRYAYENLVAQSSSGTFNKKFGDFIKENFMYLKANSTDRIMLPPPIQMCPPGYILRGLEVNKDSNEYIKGILGIYCVNPRVPNTKNSSKCGSKTLSKNYPCYVQTSIDASTSSGAGVDYTIPFYPSGVNNTSEAKTMVGTVLKDLQEMGDFARV